jgi:RTX calcium-binding nonapeptide repeat (4 copies)
MRGSRRRGMIAAAVAAVVALVFASVAFALTINGTSGDDFLVGTNAADTINARGGNDTAVGLGGPDRVVGALGNDDLFGNAGNDTLDAGLGIDELNDTSGLNSGDNADVDKLYGGLDSDVLRANDGDPFDTISGGGFGFDFCVGDTGDNFVGCEQGIEIP